VRADLLRRLVVVDTETTGTNLFEHNIVSYAFAPLCNDSVLEGFVDDKVDSVWEDAAKSFFANYEAKWRRHRKTAAAAVNEIEHYLKSISAGGDLLMVGHNVAFDRYFLEKLARGAGRSGIRGLSHRTIDTHSMLATLCVMGKVPESATSSSGAFAYYGIAPDPESRHTALGDALATRKLFRLILSDFGLALSDE